MANPVLGKSLCSDFLSQSGFCSTDRFHGNGPIHVFLFWSKAGKFNLCNQDREKKCENCHSSHWNFQQKLKRLKFFQNFKDGWRRRAFFKCKPPEVHFTIRNRVPYNKLLTNRACSDRAGEYCPLVVFVRTSLRSVRTVTTSGQYSPVRPTRSVSRRLVFASVLPEVFPRQHLKSKIFIIFKWRRSKFVKKLHGAGSVDPESVTDNDPAGFRNELENNIPWR